MKAVTLAKTQDGAYSFKRVTDLLKLDDSATTQSVMPEYDPASKSTRLFRSNDDLFIKVAD